MSDSINFIPGNLKKECLGRPKSVINRDVASGHRAGGRRTACITPRPCAEMEVRLESLRGNTSLTKAIWRVRHGGTGVGLDTGLAMEVEKLTLWIQPRSRELSWVTQHKQNRHPLAQEVGTNRTCPLLCIPSVKAEQTRRHCFPRHTVIGQHTSRRPDLLLSWVRGGWELESPPEETDLPRSVTRRRA